MLLFPVQSLDTTKNLVGIRRRSSSIPSDSVGLNFPSFHSNHSEAAVGRGSSATLLPISAGQHQTDTNLDNTTVSSGLEATAGGAAAVPGVGGPGVSSRRTSHSSLGSGSGSLSPLALLRSVTLNRAPYLPSGPEHFRSQHSASRLMPVGSNSGGLFASEQPRASSSCGGPHGDNAMSKSTLGRPYLATSSSSQGGSSSRATGPSSADQLGLMTYHTGNDSYLEPSRRSPLSAIQDASMSAISGRSSSSILAPPGRRPSLLSIQTSLADSSIGAYQLPRRSSKLIQTTGASGSMQFNGLPLDPSPSARPTPALLPSRPGSSNSCLQQGSFSTASASASGCTSQQQHQYHHQAAAITQLHKVVKRLRQHEVRKVQSFTSAGVGRAPSAGGGVSSNESLGRMLAAASRGSSIDYTQEESMGLPHGSAKHSRQASGEQGLVRSSLISVASTSAAVNHIIAAGSGSNIDCHQAWPAGSSSHGGGATACTPPDSPSRRMTNPEGIICSYCCG